ncbi:MAG: glucan biosynthesis protein G [Candidatus Adiutrix sp.]|jgi:glucans biosynthesis protein|nr:glucan biosynthesis protein G [Candidatus Adiutrix sp.]
MITVFPSLYFRLARAGLSRGALVLALLALALWGPAEAAFSEEGPVPAGAAEAGDDQPPPAAFSLADVEALARSLAGRDFVPPESAAAAFLRGISENDWNRILFKDEFRLWRDSGSPFEFTFFHPGFIYNNLLRIHVVEDGRVETLDFDPDLFNYGPAELEEPSRRQPLGFAGFRLHSPTDRPGEEDETASFLGATHFRALARHGAYGLMARALILNPALPEGEEHPYFREFWLVRPQAGDREITIYALMDSPSLTGAYRLVVKPGLSTVMGVSARLFARSGATLPKTIGLAPATGMYLFSEKENGSSRDYRPEVHSADILLLSSAEGEWIRRPLSNSPRLDVTLFPLKNPRGFGLMQADDNFDHYQDLGRRFERWPSLWVEPVGDWGTGAVELIEIPTDQDIHDNIIAFWAPDESAVNHLREGRPLSYDYRLYWMAPGVIPHQLGRAAATRQAPDPKNGTATFLIDFEGEELNGIPAATGLSCQVETTEEYPLLETRLTKNEVTGGWRLQFKVRLPNDNGMLQSLISARGDHKWPRFRAYLKKGENLPEPLTEKWVYDFFY